MDLDKVVDRVRAVEREVAEVHESVKSAHIRITENDELTKSIHDISQSVATLAVEVKNLAERFEDATERLEVSLQKQGERIGALEREPANRYNDIVKQIIGLLVAAVVGYLVSGGSF